MGAFVKATGTQQPRWEGPVVPYVLSPMLTSQMIITIGKAFAEWEGKANIRFVQRHNEADFIEFVTGQDACGSPVGRIGNKQSVSLQTNCTTAAAIHEIGHALGMIHEHQRPDATVQPVQGNIIPDKFDTNFPAIDPSSLVMCLPYDRQSIMHYGPTTFSSDATPPIAPTLVPDDGVTWVPSMVLTTLDAECVNQVYPWRGVVRRADSGPGGAGEVKEIAAARDDSLPFVTAVITATNTLMLILWQVDAFGGILRGPDSGNQADEASDIALANGSFYVSACRSKEGKLLLISWRVRPESIMRAQPPTPAQGGEATIIRIVSISPTVFLTACRVKNGNLLLNTWIVDSNGKIDPLASAEAGVVSEISLIRLDKLGSDQLVATTVRASDDRVLSIVWLVAQDGTAITRPQGGDTGTAMEKGTQISSAWSKGRLIVSCKSEDGGLLLISFSVAGDANGLTITRLNDSGDQAGEIQENAMIARPYGVLSAVRARYGESAIDQVEHRQGRHQAFW